MIQYKDDMLLFCMERPASRHALYFVELNTLREPMPRIHRYFCTARQFETFSPGGCYQLDLRGLQIVRAALEAEYDIEDTYFALLMELREMRFGDPARARTFDPGRYYTFEEMRSLIQYREPLYWRAALAVARIPAYLPALLLPVGLYLWLVLALVKGSSALAAPFGALLALPALLLSMWVLYAAADQFMLRRPTFRYGMLRQHMLRHGGERKAMQFTARDWDTMKKPVLISGGLLLLSLVMLFL